jgi:4-hydroxybenzoate polyprenyltransferase
MSVRELTASSARRGHRVTRYRRALSRLLAASRIARPHKCVVAAASVLAGAYLSAANVPPWSARVVTASIVMALVLAFAFVINDYADAVADGIAKSRRPIPAGLISRSNALRLAALLGVVAVLLGAAEGPWFALAVAGLVAVCAAYSLLDLKTVPLLGIGIVAFFSAATGVYGAFAAGGLSPAVVAFTICVFLNSYATETLYTVHDLPADVRTGTSTTAVRLGPTPTLWLFQAFTLLSVVALYVVPLELGVASPAYLVALSLLTTVPTVLAAALAGLDYDARRIARARVATRVIRLVAIAPMLLLHP